ncbi:SH3 domain-containing protein [Afifella sp. IM 167]|uniref:SH3 domain-containing protein n=1 Tax=Afifella sp. IM 167 TaxID=2033586 RepID=UPI001CC9F535
MLLLALALAPGASLAQGVQTGPSGQPLPRFVSLKSSAVNVRRGPGKNYPVAWRFVRAGLPVEIIQEFDTWRKIRDSDGAEGWIHQSLLSGRRTAIVSPWTDGERFEAHAEPRAASRVSAILESHVIADVVSCEAGWCNLRGDGYEGWLPQETLWGVYPNEKVSG